jgi:hypothetical protein
LTRRVASTLYRVREGDGGLAHDSYFGFRVRDGKRIAPSAIKVTRRVDTASCGWAHLRRNCAAGVRLVVRHPSGASAGARLVKKATPATGLPSHAVNPPRLPPDITAWGRPISRVRRARHA